MGPKFKISILLVALMGLLVAGNAAAYFTAEAEIAAAQFTAGTVEIEFIGSPEVNTKEEFVDSRQVIWEITNTGNNDVYLRVKPAGAADPEISLGVLGAKWRKGNDNYYYYSLPVSPGEETDFCLEIFFEGWSSLDFPVNIEAEAIQEANDALHVIWPDNPFQ